MTKKQYFIPQTETMPLFHMTALCASGDPVSGDAFSIGGGAIPDNAQYVGFTRSVQEAVIHMGYRFFLYIIKTIPH